MSKKRIFVGDFETTSYEGQTRTDVWASASVELFTEEVKIFNNIVDQFEYYFSLDSDLIVYYHNLKFDGSFILSYILVTLGWQQACKVLNESPLSVEWLEEKYMPDRSVKYMISDMGQWYTITLKYGEHIIQFRDSYKLLPFNLRKIGKSFKTKHQKTEIEYKGYREPCGLITEEEKNYIANDVLVIKEALELMYNDGHDKLTIGACCLHEYKSTVDKSSWEEWFPNLYEIHLDSEAYGCDNIGSYIRKAYRGGWCYNVKERSKQIVTNGVTADVNSLYPSMMHSESGNVYPIGVPTFWKGNYIPNYVANDPDRYYFIRVKTRFKIKENKLPFIQIKGSFLYPSTLSLKTSDIYNKNDGKYYDSYVDIDGNIQEARPVMTWTKTDYELILEHYDLIDFEILDGCYFATEIGIFDSYINKYKKQKQESEGAVKEEAKLFLNNLYGKMASSTNSSFKFAIPNENGTLTYKLIKENKKKPGYIPVGCAITSYARAFTIKAAQNNFYGINKRGFIYADTDSIHVDLPIVEINGITIHPTDFCCWKVESYWDEAIFTRQKTYIEHVTHKDQKPVTPYYDVKCAGMPSKCKDMFIMSMGEIDEDKFNNLTDVEREFVLAKKRTILDFDVGLSIPGKLLPKTIPGGVVLTDTTFEMR